MEIYKKESERNQWDIEEEALHVAGCAIRLLADNYYQVADNYQPVIQTKRTPVDKDDKYVPNV